MQGYTTGDALLRMGPFIVRRGRRTHDDHAVLLKVPARVSPRRTEVDALAHEGALLRGLSLAGVPRLLDFVHDPPCLVLDDAGLSPLSAVGAARAGDLTWFFAVAIELTAILSRLHHAHLVCGGVAPAAMLASADGRRVQLLDYSLAAKAALDPTITSSVTWGMTPYTSPEQTGRINRGIDHRSDLYSLGMTLYELLTGAPPFRSEDSLELVHAHLARMPLAPHIIAGEVPEQVSAIVMRLVAKAAEDRYQSARGVKADLEICARQWSASQTIAPFELAAHDVSERFLIPHRLYGRDRELAELVAAFDGACEGRAALLLVSGYSGIGKTSLISELYRPIVRQRGYFLAGKFDQVMRNLPYGALIQALRGFVWQVLAESDHRLAEWRRRLADALGSNGGVLAEVLPEIEFVLGKQPVPPALEPAEAQNRFRYVFQSFLGALARSEHPLVVFLDDLQWVDAATLDLLHALLTSPDLNHVLFIGAYRDNEVDANHLLTCGIDRLHAAGATVPRVSLGPLSRPDIVLFLCETLRSQAEDVDGLAALILENAGAERGVFLQERDGTWFIEAEATVDSDLVQVRQATPWGAGTGVAESVIVYVGRTGRDLVVGNLAADERFAGDPYITRTHARSVLCVPVGQQGRSSGLLYLENNLTTDAFTPGRIEMMRILAAQAAISLENARLYEGMKTEIARRTEAEESLREALTELGALKDRLETENVYLQEEIRTQHNFNDIVGNSQALLQVLRSVELVAPAESTVLITGETGVGKELFARAVHSRSARSGRPLVKVNCGAIAPGLVESELFGHVKGAFTGAIDKRVGRFEVANGGTILLDEIGELPLDAQVKLLRVLQEQEFEPVGSSRTIRVNVRVIAATNRNLAHAVREGTFRADLLYRLNVFPIEVPPLRDRKSDIPLLVGLFVSTLARRLGKPLHGFSTRGMQRLMEYSWPGNVRELQNVVERAAILASGPVLEPERSFMSSQPSPRDLSGTIGARETLDDIQRAHIVAVLKTTDGVVEGARGAATILGLHPNTLRSRMKKLGI